MKYILSFLLFWASTMNLVFAQENPVVIEMQLINERTQDPIPFANVRVLNENIGDVIEGNGNGNLRLEIGEDGFFKIFGDVNIEEGEYLFTMQNIVNKNFKIFWCY